MMEDLSEGDAALARKIAADLLFNRFAELAGLYARTDAAEATRAMEAIERRTFDLLTALREEFRKGGASDDSVVMVAGLLLAEAIGNAKEEIAKARAPH